MLGNPGRKFCAMRFPDEKELNKAKSGKALKGRLAAQEKNAKEIPETVQERDEPALAGRLDPHSREVWELYLDDISDRDLELLNRFYDSIAQEYKNAPSRTDASLHTISCWRLLQRRCRMENDTDGEKKYQDMINKEMATEAMRAGDSKPMETFRPDALIDRLERKGVKTYTREEVVRYIKGDKGKYDLSLDVLDTILLKIENTIRQNGGESELSFLPKSLQVTDVYNELAPKMTLREERAMHDLGETVPPRE